MLLLLKTSWWPTDWFNSRRNRAASMWLPWKSWRRRVKWRSRGLLTSPNRWKSCSKRKGSWRSSWLSGDQHSLQPSAWQPSDLCLTFCDLCSFSNSSCVELRQELENQRTELSQQLQNLRAELESEGGALQHRLEDEVAGRGRWKDMDVLMVTVWMIPEYSDRNTEDRLEPTRVIGALWLADTCPLL